MRFSDIIREYKKLKEKILLSDKFLNYQYVVKFLMKISDKVILKLEYPYKMSNNYLFKGIRRNKLNKAYLTGKKKFISKFERKKKVLLLSYPRSGNSWIRYCLEFVTKTRTIDIYREDDDLFEGLLERDLNKDPFIFKVHYPIHVSNFNIKSDYLILLYRNYKEYIPGELREKVRNPLILVRNLNFWIYHNYHLINLKRGNFKFFYLLYYFINFIFYF